MCHLSSEQIVSGRDYLSSLPYRHFSMPDWDGCVKDKVGSHEGLLVRGFIEVDLIGFGVFTFFYYVIYNFVVFRNKSVFIIEILQAGKKLSFSRSKIIGFTFEILRIDPHAEI